MKPQPCHRPFDSSRSWPIIPVLLGTLLLGVGMSGAVPAAGRDPAPVVSDPDTSEFDLYEVVGMLIIAAENFAVERGLGYAALNDTHALSTQGREALDRRRQTADAVLLDALGRLRGDAVPEVSGRERLLSELEVQFDEHARLRRQMDRALARPRDDRNRSLSMRWFRHATRLIEIAERLSHVFQRDLTARGSTALRTLGIQQYMRVMAEFSGRERAVLGAAIAARTPIARDEEVKLRWYRNRVDAAWRAAEIWSRDAHIQARLHQFFDQVRARFFGEFQAARDAVYEAGRRNGRYPMSSQEWFDRANRAIESIVALRKAASAMDADSVSVEPTTDKRFNLRLAPVSRI